MRSTHPVSTKVPRTNFSFPLNLSQKTQEVMGSVLSLDQSLHVAWMVTGVAGTHAWGYCRALPLPWLCLPPCDSSDTKRIPSSGSKKGLWSARKYGRGASGKKWPLKSSLTFSPPASLPPCSWWVARQEVRPETCF